MSSSSVRRKRFGAPKLPHSLRWFFGDTLPKLIFGAADRLFASFAGVHGLRGESHVGPVVLVMPSSQFRLVRWRILTWLQLDRSASSRMHSGIVVPRSDEVLEVSQGPYAVATGRRIESSKQAVRPGVEYRDVFTALESIDVEPGYRRPTVAEVLLSRVEVLTFSSIPQPVWDRMRKSRFLRRRLLLLGTFELTNAHARTYLWNQLPLTAAIGAGVWFERIQDSPDYGWPTPQDSSFRVDDSYAREPSHAVLFDDYGDETYFERGASGDSFPAPLPYVASLDDPLKDPSSQAIDKLRKGTTRISGQDDASAATRFALAPIGQRYPDPMSQIEKITRYCLSTSHVARKWEGFYSAGYEAARPGDIHLLAASLCSALLLHPQIEDARTTADGKLQFGVNLALPGRWGGYWPTTTSWLLAPADSPRLATAYVSSKAGTDELSPTLILPAGVEADYSSLASHVHTESARYAGERSSDGGSAFGWLWIRHDHPRSAEFARWLRRSGEGSSRTFTRRRLGGRVTQWPLNGSDGASTEARLAMAQCLLLLADVRSHREFVWH